MANRTVSVALVADVAQYQSAMARAAATTKSVGTEAATAGSKVRGGFDMAGRGATLLTGVLAGGVALGIGNVVGAASDLNETLNKSNVIFGQNADRIERWASNAARDFGLSKQAALEAAASLGNMFQQLGFTGDEAASASTNVVKLAADLGSFNNLETDDVLQRIQAAFRGEYDSLQLLIPNINAARVETEALAATGKKNKDELTAQEKATATLAIVQRDGAAAANDFAETSDGLANSTKIATAEFEDLKAQIGQELLPIAQGLMHFLSDTAIPVIGEVAGNVADLVKWFGDLPGPVQAAVVAAAAWAVAGERILGALRPMGGLFSSVRGTMSAFSEALGYARANGDGLSTVLRSVGGYAGGQVATGFRNLAKAIGPELGIAAAVFVIGDLASSLSKMANAGDEARAKVNDLNESLSDTTGTARLKATADAIDDIRDSLEDARAVVEGTGGDAIGAFGNPLLLAQVKAGYDDAAESVEVYKDAIRDLEQQQRVIKDTTAGLADLWGISADRVDELAEKYDIDLSEGVAAATGAIYRAIAAEKDQGDASETASLSTELYAAQLADAADAADEAKKSTDQFKLSLDILTGAHVSLIQVQAAYETALDEAADAVEGLDGAVLDANGHLNLQTEAGRAAAATLLDIRDSGNQLIATMIEQGATEDDVRAADAELRQSFIDSARQMGISQQAAEDLADQILGIPSERETTIKADTQVASAAVSDFQEQIDNLHGTTVQIQANWANGGSLNGSMRFDFANGGLVDFYAAGGVRENHTAQIAPAGSMRVWAEPETGGEAYIPLAPAKRGRSLDIWRETGRRLGAMHYADGGVNAPTVRADFTPIATFARQAAADVRKLLEPATGMVGALNWARTQVGRPYLWGGVGPGGYDCSGFMSALTNLIRGRSPYARLGSTATFPWSGFSPGYGNFTIGSTQDAGDGIGHMAGTLLGVNVESAGGVGVRVGPSARGASSGLFSTRAHLAMFNGGLIDEPVFGLGARSGNSYSFAERGPEVVLPTSREFSGGGSSVAVQAPVPNFDGMRLTGTVRLDPASGLIEFTDARIEASHETAVRSLAARGVRP